MSKPITFGVELEFTIAYLPEHSEITQPIPDLNGRTIHFPDLPPPSLSSITANPANPFALFPPDSEHNIYSHIASTLHTAGFPCSPTSYFDRDITSWQIISDPSIQYDGTAHSFSEDPEIERFGYLQQDVEIVSPKFLLTPENLQQVEEVCTLLNTSYKIYTNQSTGFHVHLGHDDAGFEDGDLRNLVAFLYTFELHLSSLHPYHRTLTREYGAQMRDTSNSSQIFQRENGRLPTAAEWCMQLQKYKSPRKMIWNCVHDAGTGKGGNYNFNGVSPLDPYKPDVRKTIEFRQHAGTMDGVAVTHWIEVLSGIIQFCESGHPISFCDLLTHVWKLETWQREGVLALDGENEDEFGPTVSEEGFTVIQLLEWMGLGEQADFYRDKVQHHRPESKFGAWKMKWEFEGIRSGIWRGTEEYRELDELRKTWKCLSEVVVALGGMGEDMGWLGFDPEGEMWPAHEIKAVTYDRYGEEVEGEEMEEWAM